MKSNNRSKIRATCGKVFYIIKRQMDWRLSGKKFARMTGDVNDFPALIFHHETPLIRNLTKVDMWLQHNKIRNLEIAVRRLDNLIISPGEVFSFWLLLGEPTKAKGYIEGFILDNGQVKPGVGGVVPVNQFNLLDDLAYSVSCD